MAVTSQMQYTKPYQWYPEPYCCNVHCAAQRQAVWLGGLSRLLLCLSIELELGIPLGGGVVINLSASDLSMPSTTIIISMWTLSFPLQPRV